MSNSNIKVGFKTGSQVVIDSLLEKGASAGATQGAFYLAQDTHRLYIGNNDGSISPINEGIITISSISELPSVSEATQGQFYYIKGPAINILCVCSGTKWVQINPDTNIEPVLIEGKIENQTNGVSILESFKYKDRYKNLLSTDENKIFEIESNSLKIEAEDSKINVNLSWGIF